MTQFYFYRIGDQSPFHVEEVGSLTSTIFRSIINLGWHFMTNGHTIICKTSGSRSFDLRFVGTYRSGVLYVDGKEVRQFNHLYDDVRR